MKKLAKAFKNGANQQTIKHSNRGLVFDVLNTIGMCSRTQLAEFTGLTKTSITNITAEMLEENIICEMGVADSSMGRKPVMLDISSSSPCALGLSINRDFIYASLVNLRGELKFEKSYVIRENETEETFWKGLFDCCNTILKSKYAGESRILGIGVASIGPLDINKGMILSPPNFKGLHNLEIVSVLREKYGMPVFMNNDMNAGAIAEMLFGYGRQLTNFVYVGVTNGIGAGVVLDKAFYMGSHGFAAEIGHISIDYKGKQCPCGNKGCLELYAGIPYVVEDAQKSAQENVSLLSSLKELRWRDVVDAAYKGDDVANGVIARLIDYLVIGCVTLANLYDPQVIFLGHDIAIAGDLIIESLKKKVNEMIFSKGISKVDVMVSKFGDMPYKMNGAAAIIYQYLHSTGTL